MIKYGYKQKIINSLDHILFNSNNFYNYKGLNFLSKIKYKNKYLVIIFHGSVNGNGINRVIFRGFDYNIENTDIVCISDFLLNKYENYVINWTLSTKKYNVDYIYKELFSYLINKKKYNKIIFTGTSAGGYPSIKFACFFNSFALISNSQIYLEKYSSFNKLKNMVNKNDDEILYNDKQIENIIEKNKPKRIVIFNNKKDSTYNNHVIPFINYIKTNKMSNILKVCFFDYNGIIPKNKNHHHIQFPDNEKHLDALKYCLNNIVEYL